MILSSLVMFVPYPRPLGITYIDFCNYRLPWSLVSMDFITNLPPSNSFDNIFVVVDQLTKMVHFVLYKRTSSSKYTTKFFL